MSIITRNLFIVLLRVLKKKISKLNFKDLMAKVSDKKAVARLSKELKKLKKKGFKGADAGPSNNSMLLWTAKVIGPKGCPYEGGKFKVQIAFTEDYPMKPPELKFLTKIYHPSVKKSDGTVCPAIIGKNWAPVLNIFYSYVIIYYYLFVLDILKRNIGFNFDYTFI